MAITAVKEAKNKNDRDGEFSMAKYRQRHIAMQLQYEGEPFFGFASQVPNHRKCITCASCASGWRL